MDIIGTVVDSKFRISALLGEGGIGSVYKAEQPELSRTVAMKVLHDAVAQDEDSKLRFEQEARILGTLSNPHIVEVYNFGLLPNGNPYLTMEYLEGRTLAELLSERKRLEWKQVTSIGIQICQALSAAHSNGVIHRDLKPQNIMLIQTPEPNFVKVLDFGLSRLLTEAAQERQKLTQTGALVGSIYYMSPESCAGLKADNRSDIYSLGCILYECLAGNPTLECDKSIGMLYKHQHEMPVPLSTHPHLKDMPKELELIVFKALQKNPDARFQTMSEFEEALSLLERGDLKALQLTGVEMTNSSGGKRRQTAGAVIAATAVVALTGIAFLGYRGLSKTPTVSMSTRVARIEESTKKLDEAERLFSSGNIKSAQDLALSILPKIGTLSRETERNEESARKDLKILQRLAPLFKGRTFEGSPKEWFRFVDLNNKNCLPSREQCDLHLAEARIGSHFPTYSLGTTTKYFLVISELAQEKDAERCEAILKEAKNIPTTNAMAEFYMILAQGHTNIAKQDYVAAGKDADLARESLDRVCPRTDPNSTYFRQNRILSLLALEQRLPDLTRARKTLLEAEYLSTFCGSIQGRAFLKDAERYNFAIDKLDDVVAVAKVPELKAHAKGKLDELIKARDAKISFDVLQAHNVSKFDWLDFPAVKNLAQ